MPDLSFADYAEGIAGLAAIVAALGLGAVHLRALLLPGWNGAPARLAEIILGLAALTIILQLLGAVGLLEPLPLIAGGVIVGVGAAAWAGGRAGRPEDLENGLPSEARRSDGRSARPFLQGGLLTGLAIAAAVLVTAHWATGVQDSWGRGMNGFDTLWYHAPFAARFVQDGSVWSFHFTDTQYLNWFHPDNSELLHAAGILLFDRDLLSPLLNMGWLAVALLAAWCVGRPYGVAPVTLIAVAAILDTGTMVPREPGNAANDIGPAALLLAAAAILITWQAASPRSGNRSRIPWAVGPLIVAGLAAGLAVGTKLTIAAGIGALTIGVIVLAKAGTRLRTTGIWFAAGAATGGFWFVRNIVHTGNPIPWITDIGPISVPGPERGLEGREPFSVAHYLFDTSTAVETGVFFPSLHDVVGVAWPALLALAAAGMILALARGRPPVARVLGAVAIVAAIAYAFTPLTASGPEGEAAGFAINLRYLIPSLALGLALLSLDRWLEPRGRRVAAGLAFAALLVIVTLTADQANRAWSDDYASIPAAIAIGVAIVAVPFALVRLGRRAPAVAVAAALALAAIGATALWLEQDDYFDGRYQDEIRFGLGGAIRWAEEQSDERIALTGSASGFFQYGFYGADLTNHVQYVGREGPEGEFVAIPKCAEWKQAVNDGDYTHVVTSGELDLNFPAEDKPSPEEAWIGGDPAAEPILTEGRVTVFELDGDLDLATCAKAPS